MRTHYFIYFIAACFLMASCASNKYADITKVNPDNKITGKGIGKATAPQAPQEMQEEVVIAEQVVPTEELAVTAKAEDTRVEEVVTEKAVAPVAAPQAVEVAATADRNISIAPPAFLQNGTMSTVKAEKASKGFFAKVKNSINTVLKPQINILLLILAFFIPPLAVGLTLGIGGVFWLNLILTLLFFLPGMIHAIIVVANNT